MSSRINHVYVLQTYMYIKQKKIIRKFSFKSGHISFRITEAILSPKSLIVTVCSVFHISRKPLTPVSHRETRVGIPLSTPDNDAPLVVLSLGFSDRSLLVPVLSLSLCVRSLPHTHTHTLRYRRLLNCSERRVRLCRSLLRAIVLLLSGAHYLISWLVRAGLARINTPECAREHEIHLIGRV